ncbi:MAG TPA: glucose-6-phosphate isomerase family protein [Terriglobia bacterium]|nr:glucose-6-phosphate isomerase family protein [Terriglobia bacterium]
MSTVSGHSDSTPTSAVAEAGGHSQIRVDLRTGALQGERIQHVRRCVHDLKGLFLDEQARLAFDPETIVYQVESYFPVKEGELGGLFWGTTFIEPGMVGKEYFMTKGHFHAQRHRAEYYLTLTGCGALILMDESRRTTFEAMRPGSLHYIPSHVAHRVANVGNEVLSFTACWPSDAGHDYESIAADGFSARLLDVGGKPTLVEGK